MNLGDRLTPGGQQNFEILLARAVGRGQSVRQSKSMEGSR